MSDSGHYPILLEHGIVPDVLTLPEGVSHNLTIKWPNAKLDTPGQELNREDTQPEPKLYLTPAVSLVRGPLSLSPDISPPWNLAN